MSINRPLVFIGSSAEGLPVAKAVQLELERCAECVIWHQGVFGLSDGNMEALVRALSTFDFAILVLTPDDLVASRGTTEPAPRDNVLLELGLFIGGLGRDRTFMIIDRTAQLRLPSDLAGITPATYEPPTGGTMQSAVGPACTRIEVEIGALGRKNLKTPIHISGSFFEDVRVGSGIELKIRNISSEDFPPYFVSIVHPDRGNWNCFPSKRSGPLLPEQERTHRCVVVPSSGQISPFFGIFRHEVPKLRAIDPDKFTFRLVLEDSDKSLYENARFGRALAKLLGQAKAAANGFGWEAESETEFFDVLFSEWPPRNSK